MPPSLFLKAAAVAVSCFTVAVSGAIARHGPLGRHAPVAPRSTSQVYTLTDSFTGSNFFDNFDFFTDDDPTHGYVDYQSKSAAMPSLANVNGVGQVYMGVDHQTIIQQGSTVRGRKSVRVTSFNKYNGGLFIADIAHMPGSICGVWPAFWTVGLDNWPADGEVDILENINEASMNQETLHTSANCYLGSNQGGTLIGNNCNATDNSGCAVSDTPSQNQPSYGTNFNYNLGGVYAMEWTSTTIKIWNFPRSSIPGDITSGAPTPANWGNPTLTTENGNCDVSSHFRNHQIVFDTTFCGDWAGNSYFWGQTSCSAQYSSCQDYVMANSDVFEEAYWLINSVNVYQLETPATTTTTTTSTTTTTTSGTSTTTSQTSTSGSSTTTGTTSGTATTGSSSTTGSADPTTTATTTGSGTTAGSGTTTGSATTTGSTTSTSITTPGGVFLQGSTTTSTSSTFTGYRNTTMTIRSSTATSATTITSGSSPNNGAGSSITATTTTTGLTTTQGSDSGSGSYTTSTVYTTKSYTVTQCPTTVTNCPAASTKVYVSTIALYTTVCPVSGSQTTAPPAPLAGGSGGSGASTTSTVYTTALITMTKCPPTVPSCPVGTKTVITSTYALYTTVCPVSGPTSIPAGNGNGKSGTSAPALIPSKPTPLTSLVYHTVIPLPVTSTAASFPAGNGTGVKTTILSSRAVTKVVTFTPPPAGGVASSTAAPVPTKKLPVPNAAAASSRSGGGIISFVVLVIGAAVLLL